jgi:hypothetical protein
MAALPLILDTDLDTDCDDVGALAMAQALQRRGVIRLEAVICSAPVPACGPCALLLNEYAGTPTLPVGVFTLPPAQRSPRFDLYDDHRRRAAEYYGPAGLYNEILVRSRFGANSPALPSALSVYRRRLAGAPPNSVTICAIGTLSALAELLDSEADDASPLSGPELVRQKVRLLVTMAIGTYPAGRDGFNWAMDLPGAARVLNDWPTELAVSPAGEDVQTGAALSTACHAENPFRRAYEIHRGGPGRSRSSWDQVALLYAAGLAPELFQQTAGRGLHFAAASGQHTWLEAPAAAPRRHVLPLPDAETLARLIEPWMLAGAAPLA